MSFAILYLFTHCKGVAGTSVMVGTIPSNVYLHYLPLWYLLFAHSGLHVCTVHSKRMNTSQVHCVALIEQELHVPLYPKREGGGGAATTTLYAYWKGWHWLALALSLLAMDTSYIPCPVPPVTAVSRQTTLSGDSVNDGGEMHFVSSPSLLAPVVPSPDTTPSYLQPPPQLRETERVCVVTLRSLPHVQWYALTSTEGLVQFHTASGHLNLKLSQSWVQYRHCLGIQYQLLRAALSLRHTAWWTLIMKHKRWHLMK